MEIATPGGHREKDVTKRLDPLAMTDFEVSAIYWLLGIIQLVGLTSGWIARLSEGSCCQTLCQRFFLGCLLLVGASNMISVGLGPGCWLGCGFTLAAMVLTVTVDFSRSRQPTAAW